MGEADAAGVRGRRRSALRLGAFYAAAFGAIGIQLPFWPVWLESARGMAPTEVGLLLAAMYWPKVAGSLGLAWLADRSGARGRLLVGLAAAAFVTTLLFGIADGFWALLALSLIGGAAMSGILPLGEATALEETRAAGVDYGRVRLAGSLTFILAAVGGGIAIEQHGAALILPLLLAALLALLGACLVMPATRRQASRDGRSGLRDVVRIGGLWPPLIAAALIQVSHAVYYGFATIHWRSAGLGESTIGWLWAEAVLAEVVLFALAGRFLAIRPVTVLTVAGLLGATRWVATGLIEDVPGLLLIQILHAASFGLTHLATMRHLQQRVAGALTTAQGLFASLMALAFGVMTPLAGWLYEVMRGEAFLVVASLPLAAAVMLAVRHGEPS